MAWLEKEPLAELIVKDILGFNMPKILVTRKRSEMFDSAVSEFANTATTLLGSLTIPWVVRQAAQKITGLTEQQFKKDVARKEIPKLAPKLMYARLGVALGFMLPFASLFWANPFFRNYITIKKMKTANFEEIIGLQDQGKPKKASESPEVAAAKQLNKVKTIVGIGTALGIAAFGILMSMAKGTKAVAGSTGSTLKWMFEKFDLKKGWQIPGGWATFLFWSAPAYIGWIQAARSGHEQREQGIKSVNALLWFFGFPALVNWLSKGPFTKIMGKATLNEDNKFKVPDMKDINKFAEEVKRTKGAAEAEKVLKTLQSYKRWHFIGSLGGTIVLLATMPILLNIYLTKRRYKQEQEEKAKVMEIAPAPMPTYPTPQPISIPSIRPIQSPAFMMPSFQPMNFQPMNFSPVPQMALGQYPPHSAFRPTGT